MDFYLCPTCKTANEEYVKYCKRCGTWLLSESFPAKKVRKKRKKIAGGIFILMVATLAAVGALSAYGTAEANFGEITLGDQFKVSQLQVKDSLWSELSSAVDVTALKETHYPFRVMTVYYDENDLRLGAASGEVAHRLGENHTTTVTLTFESGIDVRKISSVRVEIIPLIY